MTCERHLERAEPEVEPPDDAFGIGGQHPDGRVGPGLGVLVAGCRHHDRCAIVEVELDDAVRHPSVQVDRSRVHDFERPALVDRADQGAVGQHDAVLACGATAEADPVCGEAASCPDASHVTPICSEPLTQQEPVIEHQAADGVVEVVTPVAGIVVAERMFEGRAGEMGSRMNRLEGLTTAGSGDRLNTSSGCAISYWSSWSSPATSTASEDCCSRPARRLLPHRGDGAGEAVEHAGVEATDVDAELERGGRDHAPQPSGEQLRLDLAPLGREVAAAVRAHGLRPAPSRQPPADVGGDQLGALAAAAERDACGRRASRDRRHEIAVSRVGRCSSAGGLVEQRWVPQREHDARRVASRRR